GAFFYHFRSKADLAEALIRRYAERDRAELEHLLARADGLSRDPLQQMLIFIGLSAEAMAGLETANPGCLYAAYCYRSGLLEEAPLEIVEGSMRHWRERLEARLIRIAELYLPRAPIDAASLADHLLAIYEGAFILSRTLAEPKLVAR